MRSLARGLLALAMAGMAASGLAAQRPHPAFVHLPEAPASASRPGGRLQVGLARQVDATADVTSTGRLLAWHRERKGLAAAIRFRVDGAAGLRLGVLVRKLPPDAVLRGYVGTGPALFSVPAHKALQAIEANRAAGDLSDDGSTWWTPTVTGPEVTLEIVLPPGTAPESVEIAVPRVSQLMQPAAPH